MPCVYYVDMYLLIVQTKRAVKFLVCATCFGALCVCWYCVCTYYSMYVCLNGCMCLTLQCQR